MKMQSLRHVMASLALASICSAAPMIAPSKGGAQGRWLQQSPRTTLLHGFLDDSASQHAYHLVAMLCATTPNSGAVYGSLEPMEEPDPGAVRQEELFLYGQYKRIADGSGKFDAVILLQLSGNGMPIVLAVGTIRGVLAPKISGFPSPMAVAFDLDGDGSDPVQAVQAPLDNATLQLASAELITQVIGLHRARDVVRAILSHAGTLRTDTPEDIVGTVQCKGTFRARWAMR